MLSFHHSWLSQPCVELKAIGVTAKTQKTNKPPQNDHFKNILLFLTEEENLRFLFIMYNFISLYHILNSF